MKNAELMAYLKDSLRSRLELIGFTEYQPDGCLLFWKEFSDDYSIDLGIGHCMNVTWRIILPVFWRIIWQRLYVLAVLGFSVFCRSFFEGAEVNEPQEKLLEKNGRFGTINGAVNL